MSGKLSCGSRPGPHPLGAYCYGSCLPSNWHHQGPAIAGIPGVRPLVSPVPDRHCCVHLKWVRFEMARPATAPFLPFAQPIVTAQLP